jgi:spore coat protein U-like protein
MKQKLVRCMVLSLALTLPYRAFAFQEAGIKVFVTVEGGCDFSDQGPTDADFGVHRSGTSNERLEKTGSLKFWCSAGTRVQVSINREVGPSYAMKQVNGDGEIAYNIPGFGSSSDTGQGPGNLITAFVNFAVEAGAMQNAPPGDYVDEVSVSINP